MLERPPHLIPVIFLTGEERAGEEVRLRAAAWLRKPVNAERLLEVVALQIPG